MISTSIDIGLEERTDFNIERIGKDKFYLKLDNVSIYGDNSRLEDLACEILIFLAERGDLGSCFCTAFPNIDANVLNEAFDKFIAEREEVW